jgi:hypothetical protein
MKHKKQKQSHTAIMFGRKRRQRQRGGPVGTEAKAVLNIKKNSKDFRYPQEGFVTHVEHSLLYAMLSDPGHYPQDVVKQKIDEEDFEVYLEVNTASSKAYNDEEEPVISYAQLSALLALSAEKLPPQEGDNNEEISSQEKLCKVLLQTVVRYAEEHDLDRGKEVQEFLQPVQRIAAKHESSAALSAILPFYVGYAASLVTLNPIPMFVGATMTAMSDTNAGEQTNVKTFAQESGRKADLEKTSLLDETDDL